MSLRSLETSVLHAVAAVLLCSVRLLAQAALLAGGMRGSAQLHALQLEVHRRQLDADALRRQLAELERMHGLAAALVRLPGDVGVTR